MLFWLKKRYRVLTVVSGATVQAKTIPTFQEPSSQEGLSEIDPTPPVFSGKTVFVMSEELEDRTYYESETADSGGSGLGSHVLYFHILICHVQALELTMWT